MSSPGCRRGPPSATQIIYRTRFRKQTPAFYRKLRRVGERAGTYRRVDDQNERWINKRVISVNHLRGSTTCCWTSAPLPVYQLRNRT
ncbi:hypothetical protein ABVT39_004757 [Epinephelus coioides]